VTGALVRFLCPVTHKQIYGTLGRAMSYCDRMERETGHAYRVYRCEHCGYFHLTSTPRRRP
jgi:rubrerythrin